MIELATWHGEGLAELTDTEGEPLFILPGAVRAIEPSDAALSDASPSVVLATYGRQFEVQQVPVEIARRLGAAAARGVWLP